MLLNISEANLYGNSLNEPPRCSRVLHCSYQYNFTKTDDNGLNNAICGEEGSPATPGKFDSVIKFSLPVCDDSGHVWQVFEKVLDESKKGVSTTDLKECCASLNNALLANSAQSIYQGTLDKAHKAIEEEFTSMCQLERIEVLIRKAMTEGSGESSTIAEGSDTVHSVKSQFETLVLDEKEREKDRLRTAIQQLDQEVRRNKEALTRLKNQVQNEITAAVEECQKMASAAAQLRSQNI